MRCWRRSARSTASGSLGDVVGYGPEPDGVVGRLAAIGATRRPRQPRRGRGRAASTSSCFNRDARRGDGVDARRDRRRRPAPGWRPCRSGWIEDTFTLVHGSPRDPTWEYVTTTPSRAAETSPRSTRPIGLHGHTHLPIAFRSTDDGQLETVSPPAAGSSVDARRPAGPAQPGQRRPATRRDPDRGWLLLDTDAGTATWHRTAYDVAAASAGDGGARACRERLVARLSIGV